ncbi:BZIP domain-containing protein [Mycena kentingensis (nom. inval.)]|nr:BZIP domain-containing protein [Mycena kentingensis (nom. inval.)]
MLQFSPSYSPSQDFPAYYALPPSPPMSNGESPASSHALLRGPQHFDPEHCVPTSQLFDGTSFLQEPAIPRLTTVISPSKRSASPELPQQPKRRAAAERVSSKDFVPPDVSGLSKREARLVKNRAAAFLSRQRKREEFEQMEVRVAELEQENARLLAFASGHMPPPMKNGSTDALVSEIELLRAQLMAAEERERELNAELKAKGASHDVPPVKLEPSEPSFLVPSSSSRALAPHKSAASFGLMVLLCALPSLVSSSSNAQSSLTSTFSIPPSQLTSPSSFDVHSSLPNEFEWSGSALMDSDKRRRSGAATQKLAFADTEASVLAGLGALDISFDTSPSEDGKIRVRIHPSSSTPTRAPSPSGPFPSKQDDIEVSTFWSQPDSTTTDSYMGFPSATGSDPFLGVGAYPSPHSSSSSPFIYNNEELASASTTASSAEYSSTNEYSTDLGVSSEYSVGEGSAKRRVRIALKSLPASGNECGEWEVEFC